MSDHLVRDRYHELLAKHGLEHPGDPGDLADYPPEVREAGLLAFKEWVKEACSLITPEMLASRPFWVSEEEWQKKKSENK